MTWSLAFSPVVPTAFIIGLAALGGILVFWGLFRRLRGAWIRAAALVAMILALINPVFLSEDRQMLPTVVAMVVDESASQDLDNRTPTTAAMRDALAERFAGFGQIELRTVEAGASRSGSDGTELFAALAAELADVPPDRLGAVVMLTDGQVHDVPAPGGELTAGAPVHVLLSGNENERDRRIVIEKAPRFGIVGENQTITYRVLDEGAVAGVGEVTLNVSRDGEFLTSETVSVGEEQNFTFEVPHGGPNILEFEAEELAGELTPINNRAVVEIEGIRENLRVLLVSGSPHAGERTWRNLLKSDAAVDLVHFTILRPPEKQDGTPINQLSLIAFPTRELFSVKIDEFDLIIFDRYQRHGVLPIIYFDNIAMYVRQGGAVLVAAGPDYADTASLYRTPLSQVLPAAPTGRIIEEPYFANVTDRGNRHPVTRGLDGAEFDPPHWSRWFRLIDVGETEGEVVMSGAGDRPLLVLDRQQEGRVALLLSDHAWLWARGFEGGGPHVDLLRRLAHWLMKEPDLEEESLRARAGAGVLEIERQTMAETVGPVTIQSPSDKIQTMTLTEMEPGLWRGTLPVDEIGLWRAEEGGKQALAHVGPLNPREFLNVRSSPDLLEPVVEATSGHLARMGDAAGSLAVPRVVPVRAGGSYSGSDWIGVRMTEASLLRGIDRLPLFAGFLGLALLLGALAATWYREGR